MKAAQLGRRCSQLSNTRSALRSCRKAISRSVGESLGVGCTPSVAFVTSGSKLGSRRAASSTTHVPSG